jgi:hypothetical protein
LEYTGLFGLHLDSRCKEPRKLHFPRTRYTRLLVWLLPVNNEGRFNLRAKYIEVGMAAVIQFISMKIHLALSLLTLQKL